MALSSWFTSMHSLGRELTRGVVQLLYPGACAVCNQPLDADVDRFCADCRHALIADPHATCPRCAGTVGAFVPLAGGCTHCRDSSFSFDRALRLGPYEGLLREVILRLKQTAGEGLAGLLGDLWAGSAGTRLSALGAQVVVPVPLHWRRRLARGYNQSEVLAWSLARQLRLPCRPGCLRRIRHTPQQTQQAASARRDNVRQAFRAYSGRDFAGKTVLLVDDVLTTGSTASEAARALRSAGASRVHVAVLARSHG